MLSPASLRVCCLAVMAPALTKADRQADCLPVGLSESFCVSKKADRFSGEGRNGELRLKSAYSSEYAQHKRRPLMQRAWWRTQKGGNRLFMKNRSENLETPSSLLYSSKIRAFRDARLKSWQNTNPTTAYAGKIKLKYTMNRNISNHKNMGLAKANTSLGLQSYKRVKQFSKENSNSGPNVMDDSLSFSDSADSSVQDNPVVSEATAIKTESVNSQLDTNSSAYKSQDAHLTKSVLDKTDEQLVSKSENSESLRSAGADNVEAVNETSVSVALTEVSSSTPEMVEEPVKVESSLEAEKPLDTAMDVFSVSIDETEMPASSLSPPSGSIDPDCSSVDMNESVAGENPATSKFVVHDENLGFASRSFGSKSLFSTWSCSKLLLNASKLHSWENWGKSPVLQDHRFGLDCGASVRKGKSCCQPTKQELESVQVMLAEKDKAVKTALMRSTNLLRRQMCVYVKKQIGGLVEHYQRKFQIPCQRLAKFSNTKSEKELVDLKAELLQSEDVKSMSTAALVNLVRKLESSGSQPQVVSPKLLTSPASVNSESQVLEPEDCEDIKDTSYLLLGSLKELVKSSDPYFTDNSDEECLSETTDDEDEDMEAFPYYKSALYKYMTERAALASSSTWLLARNHELEYRIKEYDERWSEITKAEGKVRLDEPPPPKSTESSRGAESDRAKRPALKNFMPLNGCIDPGDSVYIQKSSTDKPALTAEVENTSCTEAVVSEKDSGESCSRTKPLDTESFRKRKLAFIPGLHATCPKFSRLSSVSCQCNSQSDLAPCILCTGQYNSIQSVDPHSMALRDRISILESYYHPALSTGKDIPLCFQLENYVKIDAAKHRSSQSMSSVAEDEPLQQRPKFPEFRPQSKLSIYARSLSAKYRNKHRRHPGHFRRHKLVFGKWRRLHTRSALQARTRFRRRFAVASSDSSLDSPVHSPSSVFEDGFEKRQREGNQFDIDNVIIPCNSRSGRLVEIQYKEIMIPQWRSTENDVLLIDHEENEEPENITDPFLVKKHDMLQVEEKEKMKRSALGLSRRRRIRCDSRADSSGANTPDPTTLYNNQENVFRVPNFTGIENPVSPASPATPNSVVASDDSQSAHGNGSGKSDSKPVKKASDESSNFAQSAVEYDEVSPFEPLQFPLSDEVYEDLVAESDHNKEILEFPPFSPNYPPSPMSTTSSTSTVEEEEDDFSDPEWTVVRSNRNCPDQPLVLKFAKR